MNTTHSLIAHRAPGMLKKIAAATAILFASTGVHAACDYSIANQWGNGFTATITVTNDSASTVNGWNISWQYASNVAISNSWSAALRGSNPYTASNMAWNGNLGVGQSVTFGFQATGNASQIPTITGDICNSDGPASESSSSVPSVASSSSSSSVSVISSSSAPLPPSSSSTSSEPPATCEQKCNWYGEVRPLCNNQTTGWGYENGQSCIGEQTCDTQWGGGGVVSTSCGEDDTTSSSSVSSSIPVPSSSSSSQISSSSSSSLVSSSSSTSSSSLSSSSSVSSSSSISSLSSSSSSSTSVPPAPGGDGQDWLHVEGNSIVDENGRAVWLTGANWFGFNTSERVFHGLWSAHHETLMKAIADRGINLIRVPISTELIYEWKNGVFKPANYDDYANPEMTGFTSLDVFDYTLELADKYGLKILLDVHSAAANNAGHFAPLWYEGEFTEEVFIETWEWMAERYKNNDTLIAFDLENEPHGKAHASADTSRWDGSNHPNNWKRAAEKTAARILAIHPKILILIEGVEVYPRDGVNWESGNEKDYFFTWWGGNLRGVADYPVIVPGHQQQIMYSPHDYGPSVYDQSWFYEGFNKDTLLNDAWYDNWFYIHEQEIAPLLIGEWGGHMDGGRNQFWMEELRDFMVEHKVHHTFWCINPNSGDTGGLLLHDFKTWDEEKYSLFEKSLWKLGSKYVGLDQDTPLGSNGISVNQYYQNGGVEPRGN